MKNIVLLGVLLMMSCQSDNRSWESNIQDADFLHRSMKKLTDVIVHDIFSPPVASRIYVYPSIAAYEVMQQTDSTYMSLSDQLTDMPQINPVNAKNNISYEIAAITAFVKVGRELIFSEAKITAFEDEIRKEWTDIGIPNRVLNESIAYGEQVGQQILSWADADNYKQTRTYAKYNITDQAGRWTPTPPDYMEGIEPHWSKIRPFVIISAEQFRPAPPTPYNMDKSSLFYKEMMEVYDVVKSKDTSQIAIAEFWDCNPFVSTHKGHFMFATKKITPGGHWIGIAAIASKKNGDNLLNAARAYTMVSLALADGFISCWDEKYNSNLIRPETVINEHIDQSWAPALQTPPFPEYTSGHSVVSGAASTALTSIYGDNFSYIDDVEVEYGLPIRRFNSFAEAANEAAISRLYGGIHFRPAIDNGLTQGKHIGEWVTRHIEMVGSK